MNFDFGRSIYIDFGSYKRDMALTNSFGIVYPVLCDELLCTVFGLGEQDRILDIGGGANPFVKAAVVTEPFLKSGAHRSGFAVKDGVEYVECFAEKLPFANKEFDFAIARQVFEHVNSPGAACKEIMRVAKRGFIETPQKNYELLFGANPAHNWFVSAVHNKLRFERRQFIRHFLRHPGMSAVPSSVEGQFLLHWELKNITNVQYYWEDTFEYEVMDNATGFDYTKPEHAAQAHLDVAVCGLLQGGFFLGSRENDAREAIRLKPDWALAHNTLGIILWKQGKIAEASAEFQLAVKLDDRGEFKQNSVLKNAQTEPILVDFDCGLPMDEAFWGRYIKNNSFDTARLLNEPHCR
jgi:SAM-dependent methyltransferase